MINSAGITPASGEASACAEPLEPWVISLIVLPAKQMAPIGLPSRGAFNEAGSLLEPDEILRGLEVRKLFPIDLVPSH